jgi:hypothetical protein
LKEYIYTLEDKVKENSQKIEKINEEIKELVISSFDINLNTMEKYKSLVGDLEEPSEESEPK